MSSFEIRKFTAQDIPEVMSLQRAYEQLYPHGMVVPGEVYLSAGFEEGENVLCAFDAQGCLQGYAPVFPNLTEQPGSPHTIWAEVKVAPQLNSPRELRDLLFEGVVQRASEIARRVPGHGGRLTFQYHPSEAPSIEYVTSRGCVYSESVFRMMCELSQEVSQVPAPQGVEVRPWHMDTGAEQQAYVLARNEAFPEEPVRLEDWQHFLGSPDWQEGTSITAFDGQEIAGSVSAYPDANLSEIIGRKAGATEYIFVRPAWRRKGIAAYLIAEALRYLKEHGRETAHLSVSAANENALELYRRLGYQVVDETRLYVLEI